MSTIDPHGGTLVQLLAEGAGADALRDEARNLPKLNVSERELSDLEMLAVGALSPLTGFQGEADYHSVLETMHLQSGLPWSIPVTLSIDEEGAHRLGGADAVALTASEGSEPLAVLRITEIFKRDRSKESQAVFQTEDLEHPGVKALREAGDHCVAGTLEVIALPPHDDFLEYRLRRPRPGRSSTAADGGRSSGSRHATRSTERTSTSRSARSRSSTGCWCTRWSVRRRPTTCRPTYGCAATRPCSRATTRRTGRWSRCSRRRCATQARRRRSGTRSAGRTTGAPTSSSAATMPASATTTGPTTRRRSSSEFEPGEIGITPLMFEHSFWCNRCEGMASPKTCPHDESERVSLSGTKVRDMLRAGERPPQEFSRPEVADILIAAMRGGG